MKRTRPPPRLSGHTTKLKCGDFILYLGTYRTTRPDGGLGAVVQVAMTPKSKTGSGLDKLFEDLTRAINRELQVKEMP